jgi:PAS domain S-box-containing protein
MDLTFGHGALDGLSEARLLRALESMPNAFFSLDADFRITYVNAEGERLLHCSREEMVGRIVFEAFPDAVGTAFELQYRRAMETSQPVVFEEFSTSLDSWFEVHAWPDEAMLNVSFTNVSERRTVEMQRAIALSVAEQANARLSFLTQLATALAGIRSVQEVFDRLLQAVVPAIADWSTLVVPIGEELVRVAAIHRDPTLDSLAKRLVGTYSHRFDGPSPGVVAYRNGQPLRLTRLAQQIVADLDDSISSAAYGRTLLILGDGPGLILPIKSRDEVVAVLTMVRAEGQVFDDDDLALMDAVAGRVADALEQARRVQTQRETASALQAATLPRTLPTFPGLALGAGYRAATEGSQVGGDWYDAFSLPTGSIALVVGDAAGHGLEAAAVMAQMRNALRAQMFASESPAEALASLSSLLAAHEPDAFATIICVVIDPASGEATWASAGHLAPIVVSGDGTSGYLRGQPAPPIGWVDTESQNPIREHDLVLKPADRLILYTDGLIERRRVNLDIGLTHLMILAEQTRGCDSAGACEAILRDILSASHEDDVCLLVADFKPSR